MPGKPDGIERTRLWLITLAGPIFWLALLETSARGPGMGLGSGPDATGTAEPRGSAVTFGGSDSESRAPGGLEGGSRRASGTAGSSTRGRTRGNPGDPDDSRLSPIGASGTTGGESVPGLQGPRFLGGRLGPTAVPDVRPGRSGGPGPGGAEQRRLRRERMRVQPRDPDPYTLARLPRLELPAGPDDPGPADGLTLDRAIELVLGQNLNALALRYEIPKAEADILTAGLRNNPILYGDAQFVPYGHYTNLRPGGGGGQPQYDLNVSLPLDVSTKRRARLDVARRAKRVTEAQLQDEVRNLIDQLYTSYVNVLAARETLRFSEAFLAGISRIIEQADSRRGDAESGKEGKGEEERERAKATSEAVHLLRSQQRQAQYQVREAAQVMLRTKRTLSRLLFLPDDEASTLRLRGRLREMSPVPQTDELVKLALESRPDLNAYRLGVQRAEADVRLARANRLSDVYLVYQPYTLQEGQPFGLKKTYSYAVGVNAALPVFNRNQGNIARAEWNVAQTQVERRALEFQVVQEVKAAAEDLRLSQVDAVELETVTLPAARTARDIAFREYREDPAKVGDFIDEQRDFNEVVQQYRNTLIDLRQDMLELNTAVGQRVMP